MKVKELIEMLSEQDQESIVVISGYEVGVRESKSLTKRVVELNVNTSWHYGEHEIDDRVFAGDIIPETHAHAVFLN